MNDNRRRIALLTMAGLGWALSGWLLLRGFALAGRGLFVALAGSCSGCDEVLGSSASSQFGVPLAAWGLVYFAALAMLIGTANVVSDSVARIANAVGCGVSIVLAAALLTGAGKPCLPCLLVHGINILLLVAMGTYRNREVAGGLRLR